MEDEANGLDEGLDPNVEAVEEVQQDGPEAEASSPDDQGATEAPKKHTAKDRIDELTRARREAERDAEYWRAKALERPVEAKPEPAPTTKQRPDSSQYEGGEYDPQFIEDLTDWKAELAAAKVLERVEQTNQARTAQDSLRAKGAAASDTMPDFVDKVFGGADRKEWACSPEMAEAIYSLENGHQVAYSLATNPAEAQRIARLSPMLQHMEIAKLEAKLSAPKAKVVTDAPSPAPQARGSGGKFSVSPDTDDFAAFEKQYGHK